MFNENHILKQALALAHEKILDLELTVSELREEVRKVEEVSDWRLQELRAAERQDELPGRSDGG